MVEKESQAYNVPDNGTYVPNLGTIQGSSPLADALFGKVRGRVLALFFGHPERWFYTREAIAALQVGQGAVQRELRRLAQVGILRRERRGREVYYQANPECPIYGALVDLMRKTLALVDVLRGALWELRERIPVAFVYGSMAAGTSEIHSDVDVMIIGEARFAEIAAVLGPLESVLGREVNPSVYSAQEFRRRLAEGDHFLNRVLEGPKLYLLGDEHVLERLAGSKAPSEAPNEPA